MYSWHSFSLRQAIQISELFSFFLLRVKINRTSSHVTINLIFTIFLHWSHFFPVCFLWKRTCMISFHSKYISFLSSREFSWRYTATRLSAKQIPVLNNNMAEGIKQCSYHLGHLECKDPLNKRESIHCI